MNWWREGSSQARKALLAAGLGWMLDAFDVTLFAMVSAACSSDGSPIVTDEPGR